MNIADTWRKRHTQRDHNTGYQLQVLAVAAFEAKLFRAFVPGPRVGLWCSLAVAHSEKPLACSPSLTKQNPRALPVGSSIIFFVS